MIRCGSANDISGDAAAVAVLSELDGVFALEEEEALKAFLCGKDTLFASLPTGYGKSLVKHAGLLQFAPERRRVSSGQEASSCHQLTQRAGKKI